MIDLIDELRTIPTMSGYDVRVGVLADGRHVVVKRALNQDARRSLAASRRHQESLRRLPEVRDFYPPVLAATDDAVVMPYYPAGSLDANALGDRGEFRRAVAAAVDALLMVSQAVPYPLDSREPPVDTARAFWRDQLQRRLGRLGRTGLDLGAEPFRSIVTAHAAGTFERLVHDAVTRPLCLAAHGDFGLNNIVVEGRGRIRFIDLRGETVWRGGLPWWDPALDLGTLVAFHTMIEPALGVRDGISQGPGHGLHCLTADELSEDIGRGPAGSRWVDDDPAWRTRVLLGIVVRLLGAVGTQLLSAPNDREERARRVTELLAHQWQVLRSC